MQTAVAQSAYALPNSPVDEINSNLQTIEGYIKSKKYEEAEILIREVRTELELRKRHLDPAIVYDIEEQLDLYDGILQSLG